MGLGKRFLRQLGFWSWHCAINALPSFLIAGFGGQLFDSPLATGAMVTGVACFIMGYTLLSMCLPALGNRQHLVGKALHLALRFRLVISLASLGPFLAMALEPQTSQALLFVPDYWAGFAAGLSLSLIVDITSPATLESFSYILAWTLLEGLILSLGLAMVAFFCLLGLSKQAGNRGFTSCAPRPANPLDRGR
ncbi:hypothetical protein [Roseibacillus ishigakijimensis]|nr:hypothetical protein [Roseibacillus ishigakijimensis]